MLPYPSGEPHIGHLKVYSVGDAVAHFARRNGNRVLNPMGYDAFGLPAENHAIKTGQHPRESTEAAIREFRRQFREWGISIDWTRELSTHDPGVLPLDAVALPAPVRARARLPQGGRGQVVPEGPDRPGQRAGDRRALRALRHHRRGQAAGAVVLPITEYADRLLEDMHHIEWPRHVVTMQENWIGRSEGAEVVFRCEELGIDYPVFTTRPDTIFGATFFVLAPEHPDVLRLNDSPEVHDYVNRSLNETPEERGDEHKQKTGVPLGHTVTNPATGEQIPMWVADYVLMEYGTGAVMGVPAHDARDFEFAEQFGLEIRRVIDCGELPCTDDGPMVNSGRFDGTGNREAYDQIVDWLESEGKGERSVNYRLRDWLLSRQRYWGCPIPMLYCENGRPRAGARRPAARGAAGHPGLQAEGPAAARDGHRLVEHHLPEVRRTGPARDRHDGHVRRLVLVLPALLRPAQRRGAVGPRGRGHVDAGRSVHRRHRARDPAPDVRALLREGAGGHGPRGLPGAVRQALHAGHDHARRREDVEVEGERRGARGLRPALRRGHGALLHPVHRAAVARRRLAGLRRGRRAPLPVAAVDGSRRGAGGGLRGRRAGRGRRAAPQGALGDRQGHARHADRTSASTRRSRR